jgi:hypothetical protein
MITFFKAYFVSQIKEIRDDPALRFYGSILALGQFLVYYAWVQSRNNYLGPSNPVCWPFFEDCYKYRFFNPFEIQVILAVFGACAIFCAYLFLRHKNVAVAYAWLIILNIFKMALLFQDYRLRQNQHYMLFFVTFVYLFLPNKRNLLRYTLVLFYIWAAGLKLNAEWLSGKALYHAPLWIHGRWIPIACAYVLVLEFFISWGLLSANKFIFWLSFAQFILFHIVSWPVVFYFYPLLMIGLMAIFPLTYFIKVKDRPQSLIHTLARFKEPASTYIFIAFFSMLQLVPRAFPGNSAITGEGRLFALHMFDAQVVCSGEMVLHYKYGSRKISIPFPNGPRIKCDPIVYYSKASQYCYKNHSNPSFIDLDIYYSARLSSQPVMHPLVSISEFCGRHLRYHMLKHNDWILTDKGS